MQWSAQFQWDGLTGDVQVECVPNVDPAAYATVADDVVGFPVCTAWVRYPRRGYHSMFGWVQLVRSTDNESQGSVPRRVDLTFAWPLGPPRGLSATAGGW